MPVRNWSVIRKRAVVPNAYIQAPLFGAGWLRKRPSHESAPVRSSTQPATNRPASAVRDPILPIGPITSTSLSHRLVRHYYNDAWRRENVTEMDDRDWLAQRFEENRTHRRSVAYRMLGSLSEAEDALQEAWLHLSRSEKSSVENLKDGSLRSQRECAWTCCAHAQRRVP